MKFNTGHLRGFVIIIFFLFIVIFLFSLVIPSRVVISKSVQVSVTTPTLMDSLSNAGFWKKWYPAFADKDSIQNFVATDSVFSWTEKGNTHAIQFNRVSASAVRFTYASPDEKVTDNILTCLPDPQSNNSLILEWTAVTQLGWLPWNKFSGIFLEKFTGPGYEMGLQKLSAAMESSSPGN